MFRTLLQFPEQLEEPVQSSDNLCGTRRQCAGACRS